jgi:hypothetical protein
MGGGERSFAGFVSQVAQGGFDVCFTSFACKARIPWGGHSPRGWWSRQGVCCGLWFLQLQLQLSLSLSLQLPLLFKVPLSAPSRGPRAAGRDHRVAFSWFLLLARQKKEPARRGGTRLGSDGRVDVTASPGNLGSTGGLLG